MSDYPNIAFTGKAGSGKSTAAEALLNRGYFRVSFAAPLKRTAEMIWGEGALTDRGLLQWLGQVIRERDDMAWANAARPAIDAIQQAGGLVVIDDLRFPNEYWLLKELGFTIVRIESSKHTRIERLKLNGKLQDEAQLEDTSETALDGYEVDHVIVNDGTPEEFGEQLLNVLGRERARV